MFLMKNKFVLFVTGCFALMLSACLDSDYDYSVETTRNCQIASFKVSHDSISGLEDVKFTIDQLTGRIFNQDSLPYGTVVEKVLCEIGVANSMVLGVEASPGAYEDSTYYLSSLSDSIDFSEPVRLIVHAYDNITTKVYIAQINVHQVVPDSMVWSKYADPMVDGTIREQKVVAFDYEGEPCYFMYARMAGAEASYRLYYAPVDEPGDWRPLALTGLPAEGLRLSQAVAYEDRLYIPATDGRLYESADGMTWGAVEDAPSIYTLLGEVKPSVNQSSALSAIVDREGTLVFYAMNQEREWTEGDAVASEFPVTGFGVSRYASVHHEYLLIAGGRSAADKVLNTTWATMDGLSWAVLASGDANFSAREGAMVANYDDKLFLIGGIDASGKALKDIYQSFDNGITWALQDTMVVLPADYQARAFSSIIVDEENFVNLFGGKTSADANDLNQLWRGRINRLVPAE